MFNQIMNNYLWKERYQFARHSGLVVFVVEIFAVYLDFLRRPVWRSFRSRKIIEISKIPKFNAIRFDFIGFVPGIALFVWAFLLTDSPGQIIKSILTVLIMWRIFSLFIGSINGWILESYRDDIFQSAGTKINSSQSQKNKFYATIDKLAIFT